MNLNSPYFARIRVKRAAEPAPSAVTCQHPGCTAAGEFRAPMGRMREGQYFSFCLEHVRTYNATYNYFSGMSDDDVAQYQRDASFGHRPTWTMGVNRAAATDGEVPPDFDPKGMFGDRFRAESAQTRAHAGEEPRRKRYGVAALKAIGTLGLDETADANQIKTRYKDLVKRLHPDANGGDRSSEEKLREIIHAYNYLRSAKLA